MKCFVLPFIAVLLTSCSAPPPPPAADFSKLVEDFTYGTLALSPSAATQAGYHEHNGVSLDEALDDYSPAGPGGVDAQRLFYQDIQRRRSEERRVGKECRL